MYWIDGWIHLPSVLKIDYTGYTKGIYLVGILLGLLTGCSDCVYFHLVFFPDNKDGCMYWEV